MRVISTQLLLAFLLVSFVGQAAAETLGKEEADRLWAEAEAAYRLGEYSRASDLLQRLYGTLGDEALNYAYGRALEEDGRLEEALEVYKQVQEADDSRFGSLDAAREHKTRASQARARVAAALRARHAREARVERHAKLLAAFAKAAAGSPERAALEREWIALMGERRSALQESLSRFEDERRQAVGGKTGDELSRAVTNENLLKKRRIDKLRAEAVAARDEPGPTGLARASELEALADILETGRVPQTLPPPPAAAQMPIEPKPSSGGGPPAATWILGGVALASGAASGGFYGLALGDQDDADAINGLPGRQAEYERIVERGEDRTLAHQVLLGVSLTALVAGATVWILDAGASEAPRASIAPTEGGALLTLGGRL